MSPNAASEIPEERFSFAESEPAEAPPEGGQSAAGDAAIEDDAEFVEASLPTEVAADEGSRNIDPSREVSYVRLIVELKRMESEVRRILEPKDPRRKRRFTGTRRWTELEEDIHEWRFTDRFDEPTLRELLRLIARRHSLFARLRFLAATRPTWNS